MSFLEEFSPLQRKAIDFASWWQTEGLGATRSDALRDKAIVFGFAKKRSDFDFIIKFLCGRTVARRIEKNKNNVSYILAADYEDLQLTLEGIKKDIEQLRQHAEKLVTPGMEDSAAYRLFVLEIFMLYRRLWQLLSALPRVKKQFQGIMFAWFNRYYWEIVNIILKLGLLRPSAMSGAMRLLDGLNTGIFIDLNQITIHKDLVVEKSILNDVDFALKDLTIFKGKDPAKLRILNLLQRAELMTV